MEVKLKKLSEKAVIPKYTREDDAGMDLTAIKITNENDFIEYGTGLSIELPKGYVGLIFPRGSISKKDLLLSNSVGVIDSGYTGEIMIRFQKLGEKIYNIGDRIAQLIIIPYPKIEFKEVDELSKSEREDGRFGSSGE